MASKNDEIIIQDEKIDLKTNLGKILENKTNYQMTKSKQFIINGTKCAGALNVLKDCFYGNFKDFKQKRRVKNSSSKSAGTDLHKQIYHRYTCTTKKCFCILKFGKKTKNPRKDSILHNLVKDFEKFLDDNQWTVFGCEIVVGLRDLKSATAIDVLCVDNLLNPTKCFIVELKTGYTVQRNTPRTVDPTGKMCGFVGKHIPNTFSNHHQLQLWFCFEALKKTYDIESSSQVVLYLNKDKPYKAVFQEHWWATKSQRKALMNQLSGKALLESLL